MNPHNIFYQLLALVLLLAQSASLSGQTSTTVSGTVHSKGEPVVGANVYIQDSYDGGISTAQGTFSFTTEESGDAILLVSSIGFEAWQTELTLQGDSLVFAIEIKQAFHEMKAATIQAGVFAADEANRAAVLKPLDIVTTAGSNGDIVNALQSLPGSTPAPESGRLYVRGGAAGETGVFINGMRVVEPYSSSLPQVPVRGRFNPFLFGGTMFSTGGYSAEYGQAMSAVLLLETRKMEGQNSLNLSAMSVGGDAAANAYWEGGGVTASVGMFNLAPYFKLVPQRLTWDRAPSQWDGVVHVGHQFRGGLSVKILGQFSGSQTEMRQLNLDSQLEETVSLNNGYRFGSVALKMPAGEHWLFEAGGSLNTGKTKLDVDGWKGEQLLSGGFAKVKATWLPRPETKVRVGVLQHQYVPASVLSEGADNPTAVDAPAAFVEWDQHLGNTIAFRLGGRIEQGRTEETLFAPRFSASWKPQGGGQWSLAGGRFYQLPEASVLVVDQKATSAFADQVLLGWQEQSDGRVLRFESFYKGYRQLERISDEGSVSYSGKGYAWGAEAFLRDQRLFGKLDTWVSYSLLLAERMQGSMPELSTAQNSSKHVLSWVGKWWVQDLRSQIGWRFSYASPRIYDNPNTTAYNDVTTRAFRTLDLNWSYLWKPQLILHASICNAPGFKNAYGMRFASNPDASGSYASAEILPMADRFFFLGLFWTLSNDKAENQLDKI